MKHDQLQGMRFGMLVAETCLGKTKNWIRNVYVWRCRCDCGAVSVVTSPSLVCNKTKSCGCLGRKLAAERCRNFKPAKKVKLSINRFEGIKHGRSNDCSTGSSNDPTLLGGSVE